MNDIIRLRAGNRESMPKLRDREPAYVRDEEALYIGAGSSSVKLASADTFVRLNWLETQQEEQHRRLNDLRTVQEQQAETLEQLPSDRETLKRLRNACMDASALPLLTEDADTAEIVDAYNKLIICMQSAFM